MCEQSAKHGCGGDRTTRTSADWISSAGGCALGAALVTVIISMALTGCANPANSANPAESRGSGYTMTTLYPDDVASVSVPIFENKTLFTGVERDITDALIKEIQARTPYRVLRSGNADTILTGTITGVETTKVSQVRGSGLVQDSIVAVTVDFEWKDLRTGDILVERRRFEAGDVFVSAQPISERPQIGLWAVAEELAQDIVSTMQAGW